MNYLKQIVYRTLRNSEKYFKTDMIYLAKGGFWLTLGQIITSVASFVLSIAFANLVPQTVYGTYRYATSLATTLSAFSLSGIGTAMTQSVARGSENVLRSAFWISIKWSALLVIISFTGSVYYFLKDNIVLSVSLLFIGSFSPFLNSANIAGYYANGKKDFTRLSAYSVIRGVAPALILIVTLFITKNVLVIIFVYFFVNTAVAMLVYRDAINFYKPNLVDDPDLLNYSKKLSLLSALSTVTAQADKIIIFTSIGAVELATYSVAMAFPEQIKSLLRNLNVLMVPKFAERNPEQILGLRGKTIKLALLLIVLTALYFIIAPFLYKIFFPTYAMDAVALTQVFSLSILAMVAIVPNSIMIAQKKNKELFMVNTVGSVIQLILLVAGAYFAALWGIVIAKTIASYVYLFLFFYYTNKHESLKKI